MKQMLLLLAWLVSGVFPAGAAYQEGKSKSAGEDNFSPVRRGYIRLTDGSYSPFRSLTQVNDSVWFTEIDKTIIVLPLAEVQSIHRITSYAGTGVLAGGVAGLAFGILGAKAFADISDSLLDIFTLGYADDADTRSDEVQVVVFSTLVGAGVGFVTGSFFKREKVVYEQKFSVGIYPGSLRMPEGEITPAVTFQIRF